MNEVPGFVGRMIEWCMLHVSEYIRNDTTQQMSVGGRGGGGGGGGNSYIMSSIYLCCSIYLQTHCLLILFLFITPKALHDKKIDKWRSLISCSVHPIKVVLVVHNNSNLGGVTKLYFKHVLSALVVCCTHN